MVKREMLEIEQEIRISNLVFNFFDFETDIKTVVCRNEKQKTNSRKRYPRNQLQARILGFLHKTA